MLRELQKIHRASIKLMSNGLLQVIALKRPLFSPIEWLQFSAPIERVSRGGPVEEKGWRFGPSFKMQFHHTTSFLLNFRQMRFNNPHDNEHSFLAQFSVYM